jgi:hypothetical protein
MPHADAAVGSLTVAEHLEGDHDVTRLPRPFVALAALVLFALCGVAVAAKPPDDITLVTTTLPELNPGQTAWVSTLWRGTSVDATSFELTADPPKGITVSYPENTGSFSSLYKQSTLLAGDTDYVSIEVQVGDTVLGNQQIRLNVEYQAAGKKQKLKVDVTLPVVEASGPTVEQLTSTVGQIPAGSAAYVDVSYKANKPGVTEARLTAEPPAGATVTYPNDSSFSGFAADSTLSVGETDHASFRIDTGTLAPGSYEVELDLAYGNGQHLPGTVALTVS